MLAARHIGRYLLLLPTDLLPGKDHRGLQVQYRMMVTIQLLPP